MFQIAFTLCQGWKKNVNVIFRPISETPMQANQPTKYLKNVFRNIKFENITSQVPRVSFPWQYVETNQRWNMSVEFYGYFQSPKNINGYENKIREIFEPTEDFIKKIQLIYPNLLSKNTVSIHVRRGDYLTIDRILPTLDKSYFDFCLSQLQNYDSVFVCSDDITWVKKNLNYKNMIVVENLEDWEELWLMSLCKNNILSNSSFSWWSSFLNKNQNKKVFVPNTWFGPDGETNFEDIFDKNHTKIKVKFRNGVLKYEN